MKKINFIKVVSQQDVLIKFTLWRMVAIMTFLTITRRNCSRPFIAYVKGAGIPSDSLVFLMDSEAFRMRPSSALIASMVSGMTMAWLSTM